MTAVKEMERRISELERRVASLEALLRNVPWDKPVRPFVWPDRDVPRDGIIRPKVIWGQE